MINGYKNKWMYLFILPNLCKSPGTEWRAWGLFTWHVELRRSGCLGSWLHWRWICRHFIGGVLQKWRMEVRAEGGDGLCCSHSIQPLASSSVMARTVSPAGPCILASTHPQSGLWEPGTYALSKCLLNHKILKRTWIVHLFGKSSYRRSADRTVKQAKIIPLLSSTLSYANLGWHIIVTARVAMSHLRPGLEWHAASWLTPWHSPWYTSTALDPSFTFKKEPTPCQAAGFFSMSFVILSPGPHQKSHSVGKFTTS